MLALACLLGAKLILLAVPYVTGQALNTLQLHGADGIGTAARWLAGIIVLALLSWMLHGPGRYFERNVALWLRQKLSSDLIGRLVQLPLSWHESQHSGAIAHRVQQSVNALAGFAGNQYVYLSSAVALFGPLVALWLLRPIVGATAIIGMIAISVATRGFDQRMVRLAHIENDAERRYASTLLDSLGSVTTLFALRQARAFVGLMQQRLLRVFDPVRRSIVINELKWFWVDIASRLLSCMLVAQFAWLATRPHGSSSASNQLLLLGSLYMVWEYAQQAGGVVTDIAAHMAGFARLQADYASADIIRDAAPANYLAATGDAGQPAWRQLQLRSLRFRHPASRDAGPSLHGLRLSVQRGRRYALIGASGAGKSTLLRLLSGLYAADEIELILDERVTTDGESSARLLRANSTLLPQDAEVYEGTLAENLSLCESLQGLPSATDLPHALRVAQTGDFVSATPEGLDTQIVERGANWSGGQRARIALARGVLAAKGSALLLLDEPTASLDAVTEARVYESVFAEFPDAAVISSVHRMNLLSRFDEIILMRDGTIIAQGSEAALQLQSEEFRQLVASYANTVDAQGRQAQDQSQFAGSAAISVAD